MPHTLEQRKQWARDHPEEYTERNRIYSQRRKVKHRDKINAYRRKYYMKNKYKQKDQRAYDKLKTRCKIHGITPDDYFNMLRAQNGVCAICKNPEAASNKTKLAIDHDHATTKVRALLCHLCNIGLGSFRDNPLYLNNAICYLKYYNENVSLRDS